MSHFVLKNNNFSRCISEESINLIFAFWISLLLLINLLLNILGYLVFYMPITAIVRNHVVQNVILSWNFVLLKIQLLKAIKHLNRGDTSH